MSKKAVIIKNTVGVILLIVGLIWLIPAAFSHSEKYTVTKVDIVNSTAVQDECRLSVAYRRGGKEMTDVFSKTVPTGEAPQIGAQGKCHYFAFLPGRVFPGDAPGCEAPLVLCLVGMVVILFSKKSKKSKEESHA